VASMKQSSILQGVAPKGTILQVVSTTKTDTYSESIAIGVLSSNVVTGFTAAITPAATSSKILVQVSTVLAASEEFGKAAFVFRRGSTAIGIGDAASSRTRASVFGGAVSNARDVVNLSQSFMDSPSSTSELTYGISLHNSDSETQTYYMNRADNDSDESRTTRLVSTITVWEVAG